MVVDSLQDDSVRDGEHLSKIPKNKLPTLDGKSRRNANSLRTTSQIFYELTKDQEFDKFITKICVGNHQQLKLLIIRAECIEDVSDIIKTFETSQAIEQKR